jgi:demethylmacrocin O-methyltransferase
MPIKDYMKNKLTEKQMRSLNSLAKNVRSFGKRGNLNELAKIYRTDKWGLHFYTPHYNEHFNRFRNKKIVLLEIGVGGHEDPKAGGNSLRMWKKYFPYGSINAIDIFDKSSLEEKRINIFKGSQVDKEFLQGVINKIGNPDIIIDDGSHINEHMIETFKILFPLLKDGGIYAVEDTQTSYWPDFGGDSEKLDNPNTILNYLKRATDCLNHEELLLPGYEPTYLDRKIISMHFYHNLVFVYKGDNNEGSNKYQTHKVDK